MVLLNFICRKFIMEKYPSMPVLLDYCYDEDIATSWCVPFQTQYCRTAVDQWRGMWPLSAFKTRYPPGALFKNTTNAVKKIVRVIRNENTVTWYGMHTNQMTIFHHHTNRWYIMEQMLCWMVWAKERSCGKNCEGNENMRSTYVCAMAAV